MEYADPERIPGNPARHEYLNWTLHTRRPFFRAPVAPVWDHPNKHAAVLLYAFNYGAILACIVQGLFSLLMSPPAFILHLYGWIALALAVVYAVIYRCGYPTMVVRKFQERIGAQVRVP